MAEMQPQMTALRDIAADIRKHGDPYQKDIYLTGQNSASAAILAGFTAGGLEGRFLPEATNNIIENALDVGALGVGAACVLYGSLVWNRRAVNRRVQRSLTLQSQFRDAVGEAVDIVQSNRTRDAKTKKVSTDLLLRWYAPEDEEAGVIARRYSKVVEAAKESGVEKVAVDVGWLRGIGVADEKLAEYGAFEAGGNTLATHSSIQENVVDDTVTGDVLVMTTENASKLQESLKDIAPPPQIDALLRVILDSSSRTGLVTAIENYRRLGTEESRQVVLRTAATEINEQANEHYLLKRLDGTTGKTTMARMGCMTNVSHAADPTSEDDASFLSLAVDRAGASGTSERSGPLLAMFRADTLEELETRILDSQDEHIDRALAARAALYLRVMLSRAHEPATVETVSSNHARSLVREADRPETTFERFEQSRNFMGYLSKEGNVHIRNTPARRRGKAVLAAIMGIGGLGFGSMMGYSLNLIAENTQDSLTARYDAAHPDATFGTDDAFQKRYKTEGNDFERGLIAVDNATTTALEGYHEVTHAVWRAMLPDAVLRYDLPDGSVSGDARSAGLESNYGDSPDGPGDSVVHFRIKALGDEKAEGYWYSGMRDALAVTDGSESLPPYDDLNVVAIDTTSFNKPRPYSLTPLSMDEVQFELDMPMEKERLGQSLVMRPGLDIVGAHIYDAGVTDNNADTGVPVTIRNNGKTFQLDDVVGSSEKQSFYNMKQPTLRYWLAPQKMAPAYTAITGMQVFADQVVNIKQGGLRDISTFVTRPVRKSLTGNALATDDEVFEAVKSKQYSKTPYDDANLKTNKPTPQTLTDALIGFGTTAAEMPSQICNSASLVTLLAAGSEFNDKPVNQAIGFMNNGDPNTLTGDERHAWLRTDETIDPTPYSTSVTRVSQEEQGGGSDVPVLPILGAAAAGVMAYRKRSEIRDFHTRAVLGGTNLTAPLMSRGSDVVRHALYAPKSEPFNPSSPRDMHKTVGQRIKTTPRLDAETALQAIQSDKRFTRGQRWAARYYIWRHGRLATAQ